MNHYVNRVIGSSNLALYFSTFSGFCVARLTISYGFDPTGFRNSRSTGTSTAAGTAPATSATGTTAYSTELVIGAVGAASTASLTPGSGYAAAGSTSASSGGISLGVHLEWKAALTKTTQTVTGTLSASSHWAAAVQTYKPIDTTAPGTPGVPTAAGGTGVATVSWTASAESGVMYHVHRATTSGFTPAAGNEIGQTTATSYVDNGDGSSNGLAAGSYYYKLIAEDINGNTSPATTANASAAVVTTDTGVPKVALTAPAALAVVSGTTVGLTSATDASSGTTVSYGFDPTRFRNTRSVNGTITHRYLIGGLIETDNAGTLTLYDVDGPLGDLAHYTAPPTSGQTAVSFTYTNAHGDLAAEANLAGTRTAAYTYDPYGAPLETTPASTTTERWTAQWDKKLDTATGLIEMGARPYDPAAGRFYGVDPIEGGSYNQYDYSCQDPINGYDLAGTRCWSPSCAFNAVTSAASATVKFTIKHSGSISMLAGALSMVAYASCPITAGAGCVVGGGLSYVSLGASAVNAANKCVVVRSGGCTGAIADATLNAAGVGGAARATSGIRSITPLAGKTVAR